MYRPVPDPPQFRPVPAAPPPPSMMNMGPYVSHNPVPPSLPPLMSLSGPHSMPPSMLPASMPPLGPPSMPAPPTISGRPYAMPQFSFPAPSPGRPSPPILPALGPPLSMMQPPPPVAVTHPPLPMASGHHPPLTGHRPPHFVPPLPPSPPTENPPPPPPSPPPPLPPPPPSEESTVGRVLPPQPLKPSDQEIMKNIDVLVPYVVKNGPKFESFTRAKQAGDPKFAFLFEDNGSLEGVVAHEYYKWKKKCFEVQLEAEEKASKHLDYGRASGRTQDADGTPRQVANEDTVAPPSPSMSDMDMEDDFAVSPPRRDNVDQLGHGKNANFAAIPPKRENTEQQGHWHTGTSVEIELSSEKCFTIPTESSRDITHLAGASKFGTIPHKQEPMLAFGSVAKRPATGSMAEMNQVSDVREKESAKEQMPTINAGTDYRDNTPSTGKPTRNTERPERGSCYDLNTEKGFSASSGISQVQDSVESTEERPSLVVGRNILDQDAHAGTSPTSRIINQSVVEYLPRTLDHSSRQMIPLAQEHRAARVSRWGTLPLSLPLQISQESQDDPKQNQAARSQADSRGRREEAASPIRKSSSPEDIHDSPPRKSSSSEDIHVSLKGSNRKEEVELVNDKPGADTGSQRHSDSMVVDEFGRLVRESMSESDSEERRRPRKHRRSRSRSRGRNGSRSRSRSGGRGRSRSMSRSISRSRSPGGSLWRRRSFSPSPHRRGRWSRSRSRSPPWRRSYSRTPPRDSRWGGPGRGNRDWRGDREFYGRGRRGGRGPVLCIHYARGRCARGTACRYLHADREFMAQERSPWMRDERLDPPSVRDGENMAQDRGAPWPRKQRHELVNARDGEAMARDRGAWIREGGAQAERTELVNARDGEAIVQATGSWTREGEHERFHAKDVGTDQHAQFLERQGVEPVPMWGRMQANAEDASMIAKSFASSEEARMLVETDAEARKLNVAGERESTQKFDLDGVVKKVDINEVLELDKVPERRDAAFPTEVNMASESLTGLEMVDVENEREGTKEVGATENANQEVELNFGQETCNPGKTEDGTTEVCGQLGTRNTTLATDKDPLQKSSQTERSEIGDGGSSDQGEVTVGQNIELSSTSVKRESLDMGVPEISGGNEDENQDAVEEESHSSKLPKINESKEKTDLSVGDKEGSLDVQVKAKSRMNKDTVEQVEAPKRSEVKSDEEHPLSLENGPLVQSSQKTASMTPVTGVPPAHLLPAAPPPPLSYSQANSMAPPLSTVTSSAFGQPHSSIGRPHMPGYGHQQPNIPAHTFSPGNMPPYSQTNSFGPPVNNLQNATAGQTPPPVNFNISLPLPFGHQPFGQQPGVISGSVPRQSFSPGNANQYRPNLFPGHPMHEAPYQQGLTFAGGFVPRPGFPQSPIAPQQPVQPPQSGFPANQRLGFPSHLHPQGPPNMPYPLYPANLGVPPEHQPLPRPFTTDSSMQYLHPNSMDAGVQNAYGRPLTLPQSSMPWALPTSKEPSGPMPQRTGQPSSYSYSLTTVPPLKVPGVIELKSSADQYDPLSDCLDPNPKSLTPASNTMPARLENVSPSPMEKMTNEGEAANVNETGADVGVVENVSPPANWSPEQPADGAEGGQDQAQSKGKKNNRGLKLLRSAVAEHVKELLKPTWREGHLSKEAFKTIAKKAVDKVTGNLPSHHIPKSQEKVDHFMAVSRTKISKLVQGYVDKYLKL